jgi:hypothetical protein
MRYTSGNFYLLSIDASELCAFPAARGEAKYNVVSADAAGGTHRGTSRVTEGRKSVPAGVHTSSTSHETNAITFRFQIQGLHGG